MSENTAPNLAPLDDAQLRYQSLIQYASLVQNNWTNDFPGASSLGSLVAHFIEMARTLFPAFEEAVQKVKKPEERLTAKHRMVDKLNQEWEKIFQLISGAKLLGSTINIRGDFSWFDLIVTLAQRDLNLSNWDFIVVPRLSQRFALTRFRYASEFASLDMPFSAFNAPWEWGVIWHELSSRKIREIKENTRTPFLIRSVSAREKLRERTADELLNEVTMKLQSSQSVVQADLKKVTKALNAPPAPDWTSDWVEELFEDACSVLTFGEPFLGVLKSILDRTPFPSDSRHPSPEIRLRVARRLLGEEVTAEEEEQEKIEIDVTRRIRKLIDDNDLKLPVLFPENENDVHRILKELMKNFTAGTSSLESTEAVKDKLNDAVLKDKPYKRYQPQAPAEKVSAWPEVQSGDYKKMLKLMLSEGDLFSPSTHTYQDHLDFGDAIHGLTVNYYDGNGVYHSHYHIY